MVSFSHQVALLIKSFPPKGFSAEWPWLQLHTAEAPRIPLVAANLERDELLALYGCCDVLPPCLARKAPSEAWRKHCSWVWT